MKDFALLFRQPPIDTGGVSPAEMETQIKKWKEWLEGLGAQSKVIIPATRLSQEGKVLKAGGVITDGPFVEIREVLGGLIVIKAEGLDEATTLAHGCPAMDRGGSVEIRPLLDM